MDELYNDSLDLARDTCIDWIRSSSSRDISPIRAYEFGLVCSSWDLIEDKTKLAEIMGFKVYVRRHDQELFDELDDLIEQYLDENN